MRGSGLVEDPATGSWLALIGNPTRRDLASLPGDRMSERLLHECLSEGPATLGSISPPFAAIFFDGREGKAHVITDRLGFQHLYLRRERDSGLWLSSSSLALARSFPSTFDPDAAAEWLAIAHFLSERTFFREIRKLGCGERLEVIFGEARTVDMWKPTEDGWRDADPLDAFVETFLEDSRRLCAGPGVACELTAGIDSRLVLAALLEARRSISVLDGRAAEVGRVADDCQPAPKGRLPPLPRRGRP